MAALGNEEFNAEDVEPNDSPSPIPAGEYNCVIIESEEKENSKGTGTFHVFVLEVIDGEYKGRKLFERLNLKNPSEEAVRISRATLSAICRATGRLRVNDSVDLHNLPMRVKVGLEKRKDNGEMANRIKGYIPKGSTSAAPPTTPKTAPWKKK